MITDNASLNAIMDSLVDGTKVVVYDSSGNRRLAIGVVTHCLKDGFTVEGIIGDIIGIRTKLFSYTDVPMVCPA
jgi:hypothetical protein